MHKTKLRFLTIFCLILALFAFGAEFYLDTRNIKNSFWILVISMVILGSALGVIESELKDIWRKLDEKK